MNKSAWIIGVCALLTAACGARSKGGALSELSNHAVGTYIGGGSITLGNDDCTYLGSANVFHDTADKPAANAATGPRFVYAEGTITRSCNGTNAEVKAVAPTGAAITGPTVLKKGENRGDPFEAHLVANGVELGGEATTEWKLGADCTEIAQFAPVEGAPDTGRARGRRLLISGAGTCTLIAILTTGSELDPTAEKKVLEGQLAVTITQ